MTYVGRLAQMHNTKDPKESGCFSQVCPFPSPGLSSNCCWSWKLGFQNQCSSRQGGSHSGCRPRLPHVWASVWMGVLSGCNKAPFCLYACYTESLVHWEATQCSMTIPSVLSWRDPFNICFLWGKYSNWSISQGSREARSLAHWLSLNWGLVRLMFCFVFVGFLFLFCF